MFDLSVDTICTIINQARTLALGTDADGENHDPNAHGRENLLHGDTDDDDILNDEEFVDEVEDEETADEQVRTAVTN